MAATHLPRDDSTGFSADLSGTAVRRQLRMSIGVVVVLALGIVSAAVTVGAHPLDARHAVVAPELTAFHVDTNAVGAKPI